MKINVHAEVFNKVYLPRKKVYSLKIYFLDDYKQAEKDTTSRQAKYAALELIADQFLSEVKSRTFGTTHNNFEFEAGANGFTVDQVHNDNLVQVFYDVTFTVRQNCTEGSFSY